MRHRHRPSARGVQARRYALAALALGLAAPLGAGACGGGGSDAKPVAMLASSPESAAAFEAIREGFADTDHTTAGALRARVARFITQFPKDGLVPLARIVLALAEMRPGGDLAAADVELALTSELPRGTAHELWNVARARRLRLGGDAEAALGLLRPFVGKSVDPLVRATFEEELTLSALATHRDYEAISYMDAWLRASTPDEKPAAIAQVTAVVERLRREVLVGSLQAMSAQRMNLGYGADIKRILAERLVRIATTSGDAQLARMLLDADPQAFTMAGDAGAVLGDLATSRRGLNVVEGRTIGVLLPTESPALRDESADVLRGVLWALGLPRGSRNPPSSAAPPAEAALATCGALEPAPDASEPQVEDAIRLVTRDDAGSADRTEVSLDELAGEGAAMIIAGLDAETSARALRWGEEHGVPVITLVPPQGSKAASTSGAPATPGASAEAPASRASSPSSASPSFAFGLGEARDAVLDALSRAEPALAAGTAAPVVDASEVDAYPPEGGRLGGLTFGPPVSCDTPAVRAGEPRFPIEPWASDKTREWVVSGSPECAADLLGELTAARAHGVLALTLEAASLPHATGLHVISAHAGVVPEADPHDPRAEELGRFTSALGPAGWWTALGRDAGTLVRTALVSLPTDAVREPTAVSNRRVLARSSLASARARLWTSESSGWAPDQTVHRAVCAVDTTTASGAR
jgi:hypothetical protein